MPLPLLLAGPVLRRVDPGLVAVQVVLSEPAGVRVTVWEGRVASDTTNPPFATSADPPDPNAAPPHPGETTVRIGEQLHLGLVTVRLPPSSGRVFQPDRLYSYNVTVTGAQNTTDLAGLGLLGPHTVSGVECGPLGYADRMLPSFALPPSTLDDLRIAYGSCRRPGYDDGDALAWMDEYLNERFDDPRGRIHQLFLGGDQIYADDVDSLMMLRTAQLGVELIGTDGGVPLERVKVNQVLRRPDVEPSRVDPGASYTPETPQQTEAAGDLPAGPPQFPVGDRLRLTQVSAQLTSSDGANHLMSVGEFAAAYLLAWSPACWGEEVPGAQLLAPGAGTGPALRWLDMPGADHDIDLPLQDFPERVPQHLFSDAATIAQREKDRVENAAEHTRSRLRSHRVHREFLLGLGRVQRVLANVPTYMMLDDHDVTDDFFLTPMWRHRVLGTALGHVILTNGMLGYALFQDWGNDPRRYDQVTTPDRPELGGQLPGDLLDRAARLFPRSAPGPDATVFDEIGRMFGHHLDNPPQPDGRFGVVDAPMTWHFTVDGPKHVAVALDNRTRRSYAAEIGPPGNVSTEALVDQVPRPPLPDGREVLVVVAPLQVIGPPVIDEVVAKAIYRVFDLLEAGDLTDRSSAAGNRRMPGTNPDALETWAFDAVTFEHLLARLAEHRRVVVLSGDVHNAAANVMSYWRGDAAEPARIAQLTSSGFKNVMPVYLRALDRSAMLLQELLRARLGVERLGWTRPDAELVLLPDGRTEADLVAVTRARLLRSPVLLATHGWLDDNPEGEEREDRLTSRLNPDKPPDWRWRVTPLVDDRADADRPAPIRVTPLDDAVVEAQLADPATAFAAMQAVAARHQASLDRMRNTRQMMFRSNFGICRFETDDDGVVTAVGEVHTSAVDPETQLPVLGPYMVHRASLGPQAEAPPAQLRRSVLSRVPVPEPGP
ncbi:hypothetical protein [Cellulomonas xylanilytica]|uniref:PhoD-like phosphatase metallophosphatase domain-containing protein n=1 Tax=Cellulomonas xylanilytica TaxID=233583 RepID=A0A510V3Q1_9CELL|nr:hypothetical protein [Cellulomonas xylanilytica]GEK21513.1 hypothetical protein CXY01_20330 [Cellulomonas xylanilytica]